MLIPSSHNQSNWLPPSFSSSRFQSFPDIYGSNFWRVQFSGPHKAMLQRYHLLVSSLLSSFCWWRVFLLYAAPILALFCCAYLASKSRPVCLFLAPEPPVVQGPLIHFYLTKHNTHNRQTSMPPVRFEPTISAGEQPQTYALDRAATGTGIKFTYRA